MPQKVLLALHQRHGMGVYLAQTVDSLPRKRRKRMRYMHLVLAHNLHRRGSQQLVVLKQRAGDGILYSHDAEQRSVARQLVEHKTETVARQSLYLTAGKIRMRGSVVIASGHTLYGHPSMRCRLFVCHFIKKIIPSDS